jgi:hypothetical protein
MATGANPSSFEARRRRRAPQDDGGARIKSGHDEVVAGARAKCII